MKWILGILSLVVYIYIIYHKINNTHCINAREQDREQAKE